MEGRRDQLTVISDLLEVMKISKNMTQLLYASKLSYSQLVKYLKLIKELGFAQEQKTSYSFYEITKDGKSFMRLVNKRAKVIKNKKPKELASIAVFNQNKNRHILN
jgi:predicted transcriptional regulator